MTFDVECWVIGLRRVKNIYSVSFDDETQSYFVKIWNGDVESSLKCHSE